MFEIIFEDCVKNIIVVNEEDYGGAQREYNDRQRRVLWSLMKRICWLKSF